MIRGYDEGANITILNTIYHKPVKIKDKNPNNKYSKAEYSTGSLDIVYKDLDTGEKKVQHIEDPEYEYYIANDDVPINHHMFYIDRDKVHPVKCKYREVLRSIAEHTDNEKFYYDNLKSGNYAANKELFKLNNVFNADMDIEDYYRFRFSKMYRNEPFKPTKLYFDIECDNTLLEVDRFPKMGEIPVNACTLVDEANKTVYTLLLNNPNNPLIDEFKQIENIPGMIKDFIREKVGGWKNEIRFGLDKFNYKVLFYDEEIVLIHDIFNIINITKPDFALAWNIAFDIVFLIERIKVLGYDPTEIVCHKDFVEKECWYQVDHNADTAENRNDYAHISSYTVYLDQLITFAAVRKGQRKIAPLKLDHVGDVIAGVRKLDYSKDAKKLRNLPYVNYKTFVLYNIMDTIVQLCIENKTSDCDFILTRALTMNTRYAKVHRQTYYLINKGISEFYNMGYIMGNNPNKGNPKVGFTGAYTSDPKLISDKPKYKLNGTPVNLCDNLVDFDFKALYPSIIEENNIAPYTQYGRILLDQVKGMRENRFNTPTWDRSTWFAEDYTSGNVIDFCNRWLGLASYEELYDDIIEYFTKVKNPMNGLRYTGLGTKNRIIAQTVIPNQKRKIAVLVDNTKKRKIATLVKHYKPINLKEINNNENND